MTLGEKMKHIRLFRGMTQRELGIKMGYKEENADVRIAQYEAGTRTPKESAVSVMADILKVSADSINDTSSDMEKEILLLLFWLEEENADLLQLVDSIHGNNNQTQEGKIGIYFNEGKIKVWMQEWRRQRQRLQKKEISQNEYDEWKWNWSKQ